jgi:hypothetical protein
MLIVVIGNVGSGKTQIVTALCVEHPQKPNILANYTIKLPNAKKVELDEIDVPGPGIVIFDEAYAALDSYNSGSPVNKFLSFKLFQSRKDEKTFICILQRFKRLDTNFRHLVNLIIRCYKIPGGFKYQFINPENGKSYYRYIMDKDAKKIWPYYDTYEKIDPIDKNLQILVTQNPQKINDMVDIHVAKMRELYQGAWTKAKCSDYAQRNGIPKELVNYIYNRLKWVEG